MANTFDRFSPEPMPSIPKDAVLDLGQLKTASTLQRERREFMADRMPSTGRTTYMAHGKGYVMVRHPGCMPFVVTETEWRAMPLWQKPSQDQ